MKMTSALEDCSKKCVTLHSEVIEKKSPKVELLKFTKKSSKFSIQHFLWPTTPVKVSFGSLMHLLPLGFFSSVQYFAVSSSKYLMLNIVIKYEILEQQFKNVDKVEMTSNISRWQNNINYTFTDLLRQSKLRKNFFC